jgi:hypothetical protein
LYLRHGGYRFPTGENSVFDESAYDYEHGEAAFKQLATENWGEADKFMKNYKSAPIGHTFISLIDNDGIINVYTYGHYGEGKKNGKQGPVGAGVLVHLKGTAANEYINSEFGKYLNKIKVYEISDKVVNKEKIIAHYKDIMDKNTQTLTTNMDPVGLAKASTGTSSGAVVFGNYEGITAGNAISQNCTSTVLDALHDDSSSILPYTSTNIPQDLNLGLWTMSKISPDYKKVSTGASL